MSGAPRNKEPGGAPTPSPSAPGVPESKDSNKPREVFTSYGSVGHRASRRAGLGAERGAFLRRLSLGFFAATFVLCVGYCLRAETEEYFPYLRIRTRVRSTEDEKERNNQQSVYTTLRRRGGEHKQRQSTATTAATSSKAKQAKQNTQTRRDKQHKTTTTTCRHYTTLGGSCRCLRGLVRRPSASSVPSLHYSSSFEVPSVSLQEDIGLPVSICQAVCSPDKAHSERPALLPKHRGRGKSGAGDLAISSPRHLGIYHYGIRTGTFLPT